MWTSAAFTDPEGLDLDFDEVGVAGRLAVL